jgi:hypothetical protein
MLITRKNPALLFTRYCNKAPQHLHPVGVYYYIQSFNTDIFVIVKKY